MNKLQFFLCASILMNASIFQAVDIFYEISKGNRKAVNGWVKSNPNTTMRNEQGQSILHAAVLTCDNSMVKRVLKSNVDVNVLDKAGKTALDYAVDNGNKNIVITLIQHKAKVTTAENAEFLKVFIGQSDFGFSIGKILAVVGLLWAGLGLISFVLLADLFVAGDVLPWVVLGCGICSLYGAGRLMISFWSKPESYLLTGVREN